MNGHKWKADNKKTLNNSEKTHVKDVYTASLKMQTTMRKNNM